MKALVLCAGYGSRLGILARETPKAMLTIAGEPLLGHMLRYLASYGYHQVAINLHHEPDVIRRFVEDGSRFGVSVQYSHEERLLGTAGAAKSLEMFFQDSEHFLVIYGDLLTDQDLAAMLDFHRAHEAGATLLVHRSGQSNSLVSLGEDGRIVEFVERPTDAQRTGRAHAWTNSGVYMLSRQMLQHVPSQIPVDFARDVFPAVLTDIPLYGFPLTGYRCAIDSADRYREATAAVQQGFVRFMKAVTEESERL